MKTLSKLGRQYGTDKIDSHSYLPIYERYFAPIRDRKIRFLEIGFGGYGEVNDGGASARMLQDYFTHPKTEIVVTDIYTKNLKPGDEFTFKQGSQTDKDFMKSLGSFDVAIDDGSHMSEDIIITFETMFPLMNDGGIYIIEDSQTSYFENYSPRRRSMEYFKALSDGLNYNEIRRTNYTPTYFDKNIFAIHFYHNLIIIIKGDNTETSNIVKNIYV